VEDIRLPVFFDDEKLFSSVLRVGSANIQLWTHYDIMDNLLVQVRGHKRVVLFPPCDASYLYLNGDKSEIVNIEQPDLEKFPLFRKAHSFEGLLEPGDVLFIPALWFHNVRSLEFSVAVNIFWRHLESEFYDKKDIYGNKDLVQAQRALQMVDKAVAALKDLPEEYKDFYGRRLVNIIERKLYIQT
jgi:tRNA wybutosine-synthesizing protein 5